MTELDGSFIYVMGDGDKIRDQIDQYLLNRNFSDLRHFSEALTQAVQEMKVAAVTTMDADIIMAGGDDILFRVTKEKYSVSHVEALATKFTQITGVSISFGIGNDIDFAYLNLRRAKGSRTNKIIEMENLL